MTGSSASGCHLAALRPATHRRQVLEIVIELLSIGSKVVKGQQDVVNVHPSALGELGIAVRCRGELCDVLDEQLSQDVAC